MTAEAWTCVKDITTLTEIWNNLSSDDSTTVSEELPYSEYE